MHPYLSPGTHVLRRDAHHVQVGLDPAVVLEAGAGAEQALAALARGAGDSAPASLLGPLIARGVVQPDDAGLREALPAHPSKAADDGSTRWVRHAVAALARRRADLGHALSGRRGCAVEVVAYGVSPAADLAEDLARLCDRSGLHVHRPGPRTRSVPPGLVRVLVGVGEPDRRLLDRWHHEEIPHLVVAFVEGRPTVGPFVLPGRTPCLRCLDAHRRDADPAWPLLVEQYGRATRTERGDGIPEPADPALAAVALGWATRELAAYAEGDRPATAGSTLHLDLALDGAALRHWRRHPACGCAWG